MGITRPLQEWLTVLVVGEGTARDFTIVQQESGVVDAGGYEEAAFDVQMIAYCATSYANFTLALQTAMCGEGPWRNITQIAAAVTRTLVRADARSGTTGDKFERYLRWAISAQGVTFPLETCFKICVSLR
jgi:hypothetical protein